MKSIVKVGILLPFLLLGHIVYSQDCDGTSLGTVIGDYDVNARKAVFRLKFKDLNRPKERLSIKYHFNGFVKMLDSVSIRKHSKYVYDGVSIYFGVRLSASASDDLDKMVLIFVPTTKVTKKIHSDTLSPCYSIENQELVRLPRNTAISWVRAFEQQRLPDFEKPRRLIDSNFRETSSLWYDITYLDDNLENYSLRKFLHCLIEQEKADSVIVSFGGFARRKDATYYQLTLLFDFNEKENFRTHSFSFAKDPLVTNLLKTCTEKFAGTTTDTGSPCPPASCGGTSLSKR